MNDPGAHNHDNQRDTVTMQGGRFEPKPGTFCTRPLVASCGAVEVLT
jgi:hypothetical protein